MDYAFKVTTNGRAVIATCMATDTAPVISRVAFGSGLVSESTDLADVHTLIQYVADGTIARRAHEDNWFDIDIQYSNINHTDIQKVFLMREFMIYIIDPETSEETDFIYGTLGDYIQYIPPYNSSYPVAIWTLPLTVVLTSDLTVTVSAPSGLVTYKDLTDLIQAIGMRLYSVTIPTSGWTSNTSSSGYAYSRTITVDNVTADLIPYMTVLSDSMTAAYSCGLAPFVQTVAGGIVVYASTVPTATISVNLTLYGDAAKYCAVIDGSGDSSSLKAGDGIVASSDGTLSIDTEYVASALSATDEEVEEAIDEAIAAAQKG